MPDELLLLSNSRVHGLGYLEHALPAIAAFLDGRRTVHFAPYALADHAGYTARVRAALAPLGVATVGLDEVADPRAALAAAEALFVGGGNSFRLLQALEARELLAPVRQRVAAGALRYLGASAGTNMACPTLRTTNDMPIVQPASFAAFGLIPFQINPHYQDPDSASTHMGETREQRLAEFLEENDVAVLGLREGAWLRRSGDRLRLDGRAGARLFRRGAAPAELTPEADLSWLLALPARFDHPA
ncbi:MAG TPA: dipeptidase PepE [Thermomicrobiales bacterium]|nr:dipeptidase PepE [Thermomicrobiales bacterium]